LVEKSKIALLLEKERERNEDNGLREEKKKSSLYFGREIERLWTWSNKEQA
jgi:hypothetical protein